MIVEVVLMLKCREDARINHRARLASHEAQTSRAKTVACAYPVVIDSSKEEEEEDASIYEVSPYTVKLLYLGLVR